MIISERIRYAIVQLNAEDLRLIEEAAPKGGTAENRYPEAMMRFVTQ